jgi:hypothetical protein
MKGVVVCMVARASSQDAERLKLYTLAQLNFTRFFELSKKFSS